MYSQVNYGMLTAVTDGLAQVVRVMVKRKEMWRENRVSEFIDAHIHLESSLVTPTENLWNVLPHGTTVVTDPREITMSWGQMEIEYSQAAERASIDVRACSLHAFTTPRRKSGAMLVTEEAIDSSTGILEVQGLRVMNYVGTVRWAGVESIVGTPQEDRWACARVKEALMHTSLPCTPTMKCALLLVTINRARAGDYD